MNPAAHATEHLTDYLPARRTSGRLGGRPRVGHTLDDVPPGVRTAAAAAAFIVTIAVAFAFGAQWATSSTLRVLGPSRDAASPPSGAAALGESPPLPELGYPAHVAEAVRLAADDPEDALRRAVADAELTPAKRAIVIAVPHGSVKGVRRHPPDLDRRPPEGVEPGLPLTLRGRRPRGETTDDILADLGPDVADEVDLDVEFEE